MDYTALRQTWGRLGLKPSGRNERRGHEGETPLNRRLARVSPHSVLGNKLCGIKRPHAQYVLRLRPCINSTFNDHQLLDEPPLSPHPCPQLWIMSNTSLIFSADNPSNTVISSGSDSSSGEPIYTVNTTHTGKDASYTLTTVRRGGASETGEVLASLEWNDTMSDVVMFGKLDASADFSPRTYWVLMLRK